MQVGGDQGGDCCSMPGCNPEKSSRTGGIAPLVEISGIIVGIEQFQVEIDLAGCVRAVYQHFNPVSAEHDNSLANGKEKSRG